MSNPRDVRVSLRPFAGETRLWITCASILHRPKYVSTLQLHNDTARLFLMDMAAFERLLPSTRTAAVSCIREETTMTSQLKMANFRDQFTGSERFSAQRRNAHNFDFV